MAAADGTDLSVCLAADATTAVGMLNTPFYEGSNDVCSPTITIGQLSWDQGSRGGLSDPVAAYHGELHIDCGKPGVDELCAMMDRLVVRAPVTLYMHKLLFDGLTGMRGGAV